MSESATSPEVRRKRPWLAILLTLFVPGLGHIYLRLWGRAILWLGLSVLASYLFVPEAVFPDSFTIGAVMEAGQTVSTEAVIVLFGVSLFCIVDVYVMTRQINEFVNRQEAIRAGTQATRCPNCRKELDPDIDFCHWCTTELEDLDS